MFLKFWSCLNTGFLLPDVHTEWQAISGFQGYVDTGLVCFPITGLLNTILIDIDDNVKGSKEPFVTITALLK